MGTSTAASIRPAKIKVGISSCLLGWEVRHNGSHKRDAYINGTLGEYFEFVAVCPEIAIGLGVPREPISLVKVGDEIRVRGTKTASLDVTNDLQEYGRRMARELTDISGYIFKKGSPSCGMERVKTHTEAGMPVGSDTGVYAKAFMATQPLLPVEEEGRLGDPQLRENFIERVFVYHRWQRQLALGLTPAKLIDFHTDHKYLVMAHSQVACRKLGNLIADAGTRPLESLAHVYITELMKVLKRLSSRRQHVNVMQHLLGYLRGYLDKDDRHELVKTMDDFDKGLVPLIVPITLLKHHFRRHPNPYVMRQHYLTPHPKELMLRNWV